MYLPAFSEADDAGPGGDSAASEGPRTHADRDRSPRERQPVDDREDREAADEPVVRQREADHERPPGGAEAAGEEGARGPDPEPQGPVRGGEDPLESAVNEMRRWKFSQMPVMHNGHPVGSISDKVINNLILSGRDPKDLARIRVDEVMESAFPQVDAKAPVELAAGLLRHYDAVLVTSKGDVTGIVTKSDLMKLL